MTTFAAVAGAAVAAVATAVSIRRWPGPWATNHAGRRLPVALGVSVGLGVVLGSIAAWAAEGRLPRSGPGLLLAAAIVAAVGVVDDAVPGGPRGLRGHLRALVAGSVSTGVLKAFVTVSAATVAVALIPGRPAWTRVAGVVLLAGAANLWNGLDVAPGRALKTFLPLGAVLLPFVPAGSFPALPAALGAALAVIGLDLRERAMLGDGGSNLLGFVLGTAGYLVLPGWAVAVAAAGAVGLNLLAETVTLTAVVRGARPLRWLDDLGRSAPDR